MIRVRDLPVQRVYSCVYMNTMHESLDRRHVDLLVAIHQTGQLGRAAARLNLSASAASHRLKDAERRLGIPLTVVDGRSLRLTAAAIHLAEVGDAAQRAIRSAEHTARWMASASRPAVRIAFDFYDTAPWFERLIGRPDLSSDIDFVRVGYDEVTDAVAQRRADLGVVARAGPGQVSDETTSRLCVDELVGLVREDHVAARRGCLEPNDIADTWYLTAGDRPASGFEHQEFFEPAGVLPERLRKVESLAMILRLIRSYGGVTVQPALALQSVNLRELAVVPLLDTTIPIEWRLAVRDDPNADVVDIATAIRTLVASGRT